MKNPLETALIHELCLLCGKKHNESIVMNSILIEKEAQKIKELHNKATRFSEEPCSECKENIEKAFMFIGFDEEKSDMNNLPEGFYRTGHIVGTKKDIPLVQEFVKKHQPKALELGYTFMPYQIMIQFGLIKE